MANSGQFWAINMFESSRPEEWRAPRWHPDYGDPEFELEYLRAFALWLLQHSPHSKVNLRIPEPGLMYLDVQTGQATHIEVYVVAPEFRGGPRRYGVFVSPNSPDEMEYYSDKLDSHLLEICVP